jgi:exosortase
MNRRTGAAVAAVAVAIVVLYSATLSSLVKHWASDDDFSHGFFVVPLAAYFLWERRDAFRRTPLEPSLWGAIFLAGSLLLFVAGRFGAELFLTRVSFVGVLAGTLLFLCGWRYLRIAAFPLAFLLLMIQLPAIIFNQITFPLQGIAARAGEAVIAVAGVPVLREGNILHVPGRALEVAEACSGIRSLTSLLMLAVVLGYFTEKRTGGRVLIALAAVPIAILANAGRVAGTGLAAYWVSPAAADGFFHTFSGWLVFIVAFAGLLAVQRLVEAARHSSARWREARWSPAR